MSFLHNSQSFKIYDPVMNAKLFKCSTRATLEPRVSTHDTYIGNSASLFGPEKLNFIQHVNRLCVRGWLRCIKRKDYYYAEEKIAVAHS